MQDNANVQVAAIGRTRPDWLNASVAMRWLNGSIALALGILMALQTSHAEWLWWVPCYALGMCLAASAMLRGLTTWTIRFLAVVTAISMFFYFSGFFALAPYVLADWYMHPEGQEAAGLLFAAFAMIPVLSEFSCRMKLNCPYDDHPDCRRNLAAHAS